MSWFPAVAATVAAFWLLALAAELFLWSRRDDDRWCVDGDRFEVRWDRNPQPDLEAIARLYDSGRRPSRGRCRAEVLLASEDVTGPSSDAPTPEDGQ